MDITKFKPTVFIRGSKEGVGKILRQVSTNRFEVEDGHGAVGVCRLSNESLVAGTMAIAHGATKVAKIVGEHVLGFDGKAVDFSKPSKSAEPKPAPAAKPELKPAEVVTLPPAEPLMQIEEPTPPAAE